MKKCIMIMLCAALSIGSTAVSGKLQEKKQVSEEFVNMINPFTASDSLKEAEKLAGFSIAIPEKIQGSSNRIYRSMDRTLLEVIYEDRDGMEIARVRKGTGEADISGDYTEYALEQKVSVKGKHAQLKGENNRFMLAVWSDNGYSYSVSANGLSMEKMKELVGGIE